MAEFDPSREAFLESRDVMESVLLENGYPGRWLAIGRGIEAQEDKIYLAYSFGGRSDPSKNRKVIADGEALRLVAPGMTPEQMAAEPTADLIYYHASDVKDGVFVVSNGAQTRPVLDSLASGANFEEAVSTAPTVQGKDKMIDLSSFEPDEPNFTPRITGYVDLRPDSESTFGFAVARRSPEDVDGTGDPIRTFYTAPLEALEPGLGWAIQTYGPNDPSDTVTPVESFNEDPYGVLMRGIDLDIVRHIKDSIGERTFSAAFVRTVDIPTGQFMGSVLLNSRG